MKKHIPLVVLTLLLTSCSIMTSSDISGGASSSLTNSSISSNSENISTNSIVSNITNVPISKTTFTSITTGSLGYSSSNNSSNSSANSSVSIPNIDPYIGISSTEFYSNYVPSSSYQDAQYRTAHNFLSGDETPQGHLPTSGVNRPNYGGKYYRLSDQNYQYVGQNAVSYTINSLNGTGTTIYYGAAYTSLEEVAAYLLAFGELPPNSQYDKNDKDSAILDWGIYGRVNYSIFGNNPSYFPYEPALVDYQRYRYIETDFGNIGGYINGSYTQVLYNDGTRINRGAARFVYTESYANGSPITDINDRHVFYTYNHYNDFQEYLNYYGGWGERFGFETAGNPYCSGNNEYYTRDPDSIIPPTAYPATWTTSLANL